MKIAHIKDMVNGWFVGNFTPTLYKTNAVEVAVKNYKSGGYEGLHHHKVATEITIITSGKVKMNGATYMTGDIIVIEPNEATDFLAMTDAMTTVIKIPGANNDKYIGRSE